ncbi:hypothetical protein LPA49_20350 [Pseudoalteromonas sp. MB41]|uniref:hypothetical protein n=1 Tax=Pseudoalteromonas sp. MB41 TaxID=2896366 RepID=UPI001E50A364|nr:hypothetical protein [Pseudoalteromonas sp. MB41]MCC9662899.1 hypothetical protein [Pseudoalteromonas sp. MB41]
MALIVKCLGESFANNLGSLDFIKSGLIAHYDFKATKADSEVNLVDNLAGTWFGESFEFDQNSISFPQNSASNNFFRTPIAETENLTIIASIKEGKQAHIAKGNAVGSAIIGASGSSLFQTRCNGASSAQLTLNQSTNNLVTPVIYSLRIDSTSLSTVMDSFIKERGKDYQLATVTGGARDNVIATFDLGRGISDSPTKIHEVLIYNRALTDNEMASVMQYLETKYT